MNRMLVRRIASNRRGLRVVGRKTFCNDAAAEQSSSQASNDKQDTENTVRQHDIAIVGGGMVGMALACSLASTPLTKHLTVAIIDSNPTLGKEECFKKDDPPDPRVWDYTGLGYTRYNARDVDKEVLGCVVENKVLHRSLLSCIQDTDSQKTIYPSRLTSMNLAPSLSSMRVDGTSSGPSMSTSGGLAKLELADGNSLYAKLVVGADGSKSRVRELAGFKTTGWKYSQNAIICTVEHQEDNYCAWQRFLPSGPIALLPIGDKFSNIVWTMNPKESLDRKSLSEDDFVNALNHALDSGYGPRPQSQSFGDGSIFSWLRANVTSSASECFEVPPKVVKLASERMVFPLSLMHANQYASRRVVLIGDAAHTVHPLAGQGVNLGFGDAAALSRTIAEGVKVGTDVGEVSLLKRYEADRKLANLTMMAILDGFQKAYSVDFGPLNVLRAAAFHGVQHISPLKKSIISFASGEHRLPLFS
ncbi:uncharacterized protein LOC131300399 isoform X2 [Rhododendron vialii]|uniref:uncharacterized protein LOC131300399 isoform X2 n=1 Tax=Rhododendron vialii TaxID=182163 RepID=UPI00265DDF76|nr:uncharacterized protein LOC131300399 isoform X2 [Rhododendron vialii]